MIHARGAHTLSDHSGLVRPRCRVGVLRADLPLRRAITRYTVSASAFGHECMPLMINASLRALFPRAACARKRAACTARAQQHKWQSAGILTTSSATRSHDRIATILSRVQGAQAIDIACRSRNTPQAVCTSAGGGSVWEQRVIRPYVRHVKNGIAMPCTVCKRQCSAAHKPGGQEDVSCRL